MKITGNMRKPTEVLQMKALSCVCSFVLAIALCAGCATKGPPPLTVSQIVQLSNAGVPPDDIIQRMKQSGATYPLDASQLARLKEEGVSDAVINYMQRTYVAQARRQQEMEDWELAPDYWGPWGPYPGYWGPYDWG